MKEDRPAIYIKLDQFERRLDPLVGRLLADKSDKSTADFFRVGPVTIWRLRNIPDHQVSARFIAAAISAPWPARRRRPTFDDLFEVRSAPSQGLCTCDCAREVVAA
jgi:hypothetical protein